MKKTDIAKKNSLLNTVTFYAALAGGMLVALPHAASAMQLYNGTTSGNDLVINLDTTISYTGIFRTNNPSRRLTGPANANGSEGDIDFAHGLVSNQFEVLPVLDIKDGNYGAHFSGEAYVNTSYLGTNQNNQPGTLNPISVSKNTDFTSATRNVEGLNARVLDAFVYGSQHFGADGQQTATLKIGRQTLLYGQSLFFAGNGISAGMAPFDVITANDNPNAQTQQIIEPTGQIVATYQPNQVLTLQAYYQFEWAPDYLQGVGAYFNSADILDKGGQSLILGPGFRALRTKDIRPPINNGEFGGSVQLALGNYDLGLYGIRYDSKAPTVYLAPGASYTYNLVYPRDIWAEAVGLSTTVGNANVAGELSMRQHMNLVDALGISLPNNPGNGNSNPLYPAGDTLAGQVSTIYLSSGLPLDPGGVSFAGEVAFNHVLKVTSRAVNGTFLTPHRSATAAQLQFTLTPQYYDVLPNLNVNFPIGMEYNFYGRSRIDTTENNGTGSVNFGVTATYRGVWTANITYNDYIGAANPGLSGEPSIADRNYVLLNLSRTF